MYARPAVIAMAAKWPVHIERQCVAGLRGVEFHLTLGRGRALLGFGADGSLGDHLYLGSVVAGHMNEAVDIIDFQARGRGKILPDGFFLFLIERVNGRERAHQQATGN